MDRKSEHILDEWLVVAAQSGDGPALQRLLTRWSKKLYSYALASIGHPQCAEDLVQECLMVAASDIKKLKDPSSFPKWMYQILQYRCADLIRKKQSNRKKIQKLEDEQDSFDPSVSDFSESMGLHQALKQLGEDSYQIVRLFYLDGFSTKEVASILDIPEGTVKSRLFNARSELRKYFEGEQHEQ